MPEIWRSFAILVLLLSSTTALAAPQWEDLSAEQQAALAPLQERDALSEHRRERLLQGAERWQSMSPEERQHASERFERWQKMSPEKREKLRERREAFRRLPPEQQEELRERFRRWRALPREERHKLREEYRNREHEGGPPAHRDMFDHRKPCRDRDEDMHDACPEKRPSPPPPN